MKQRHLAAALTAARSGVLRWRMALLALLALLGALGGALYAKSEHIVLGAEAYVYGYPLVIMDLTRVRANQTVGPENQLQRTRQFPRCPIQKRGAPQCRHAVHHGLHRHGPRPLGV